MSACRCMLYCLSTPYIRSVFGECAYQYCMYSRYYVCVLRVLYVRIVYTVYMIYVVHMCVLCALYTCVLGIQYSIYACYVCLLLVPGASVHVVLGRLNSKQLQEECLEWEAIETVCAHTSSVCDS